MFKRSGERFPSPAFTRATLCLVVALPSAMLAGCGSRGFMGYGGGADETEYPAQAPPEVSFPEGEETIRPGASQWARSQGNPPPTVLKFYMKSPEWQMSRHEISGAITGRYADAMMYYRGGQSGNCYRADCRVAQSEQGGSWGQPAVHCDVEVNSTGAKAGPMRYACKSVEELPGSGL